MRPLNLTLQGFTAFKNPTELDFERLHLFALSGPNGAGKSSLLEAILLALFGEAPRLRGKESISHGRAELHIGLRFQVDDKIYRVQRRYYRDKSTGQARLEIQKSEGLWQTLTDKVGETNKAIARLVGMNYDTFTKAVILPQNLFDQFLKGDKENRRQVLENLLSLKLFEQAAALAGEQSRILKERISQDELLLSELRSKTGKADFEALRAQLKTYETESAQIAENKKSLGKEMAESEKTLNLIRERKNSLASLLDQIRASQKEVDSLEKEFTRLSTASAKINRRFETELPKQKARQEALLSLRPMAARYQKLFNEEEEKKNEWTRLCDEVKGLKSQVTLMEKEKTDLQLKMTVLRSKREKLEATDSRFDLFSDLAEELQRFASVSDEIKTLRDRKKGLHQEHSKITGELSDALPRLTSLETKIRETRKANEERERRSSVDLLRQKLTAGKPCPVCNQAVREMPSRLVHSHVPTDLAPLASLEKAHQELLIQVGRLKESLERVSKETEQLEAGFNEKHRAIASLEGRLSRRLGYPSSDLLVKAREEYKALKESHEKLKEARRNEDSLAQQIARSAPELEKRASECEAADKQRLMLEALLVHLAQEKKEIEKNAKRDADLIILTARELEKQLSELDRWIRDLADEKETTLRKFHQTEERLKISAEQLEKLRQQEHEEKKALEAVVSQPDLLESRVKSLKEASGALEKRLEALQLETGKAKQQLEHLEEARGKMKSIEERRQLARKEETLCLTLHHDLQKNKLPDFLFSAVLSTLLDMAGEKFLEFSGGRYQLALEGTGEIQVLDGWNDDLSRPIESLSGGETFAASLAFALALSEYLQGRQKIQCLFIDEGFGNLDRDTRDKVAEILAHLETKEKLIGIVTHIEELAEIFPERVWIEKMPEGSRVVQGEKSDASLEPGRISESVA